MSRRKKTFTVRASQEEFWCPDCKRYVGAIEDWEPTEEGQREICWGADPESVPWYLASRTCSRCGCPLLTE